MDHHPPLLGHSAVIQCVRYAIERMRHSHAPVVLTGETGTGKTLIARMLAAPSNAPSAPFVCLDGAELGISHAPGPTANTCRATARTDIYCAWMASLGGTLFLENVAALAMDSQERLWQLLASRSKRRPGVRVIVANPRRLENAVTLGLFHRALFHRLHKFVIHLPALRYRAEDIPAMASYFAQHMGAHGVGAAALARLQAYHWPGNVRELKNVVQRAVILADKQAVIQPCHIVFDARGFTAQFAAPPRPGASHRRNPLPAARHAQADTAAPKPHAVVQNTTPAP